LLRKHRRAAPEPAEGETEELYFKHLKHLILAEEGRIANPALSVHCVIKKILSECEG